MAGLKKWGAIAVALVMSLSAAGCSGQNQVKKQDSAKPAETAAPAGKAAGTDKPLEVTVWSTMNNGEGDYKWLAKEDIVSEALAKKTGVKVVKTINEGSMKAIEKFNLLYATGEVPEVIVGWLDSGDHNLKDLIDKMKKDDMIWMWSDDELKNLAPNAYNSISPIAYELQKMKSESGDKNVALLHRGFGFNDYMTEKYPVLAKKILRIYNEENELRFRDDILKSIYPNAKTAAELEEIFKKNGKLTYEDLRVPELETYEGLKKYLYAVKDKYSAQGIIPLNLKDNPVNYLLKMTDSLALHGVYNPLQGKIVTGYVDEKDKFASVVKDLNIFFNDGILDKNYAIDKDDQRKEKLYNGKFAVAFRDGLGDVNAALTGKNYSFKYRYVPVNYKVGEKVFGEYAGVPTARCGYGYVLNKKKLDRTAAEKMLKYWDYQATKEGNDLITWGPEEAGLWVMKDGKRQWKDQEFADVVAGKKPVGQIKDYVYYGLQPGDPSTWDTKYNREFFFRAYWDKYSLSGENTVPESKAFNLQDASIDAVVAQNKGTYEDNYAAWNGTTASNKVFWDNWGKTRDLVNQAVVSKTENFDERWKAFTKHFEETVKISDYGKDQNGYVEWIKKFKDYKYHPNGKK